MQNPHEQAIIELAQKYIKDHKLSQQEGLSVLGMVGTRFITALIILMKEKNRENAIDELLAGVKRLALEELNHFETKH